METRVDKRMEALYRTECGLELWIWELICGRKQDRPAAGGESWSKGQAFAKQQWADGICKDVDVDVDFDVDMPVLTPG